MTIDPTLTTKSGLQDIGALISGPDDFVELYGLKNTEHDPSQLFKFSTSDDGLWNLQWTLSQDSAYCQAVLEYFRKGSAASIPGSLEMLVVTQAFDQTQFRAALGTYAEIMELNGMSDEKNNYELSDSLFLVSWIAAKEAIDNAIRHGSDYGRAGDVKVQMNGAEKGILLLIDDPGKHFIMEPVSAAAMQEAENLEITSGEVQPGSGLRNFTINGKAAVNTEPIPYGNRTIVRYKIPDPTPPGPHKSFGDWKRTYLTSSKS